MKIDNTYKIRYNDFGECYVGATSFESALDKFRKEFDEKKYEIKSVVSSGAANIS